MGVFDYVECDYPLPRPKPEVCEFQSKDTPAQYLDNYEIRADGTLWHLEYDTRMEKSPDAPLGFWMHRDNERWVQVPYQGELEIHDCVDDFWYSYRFWFKDGVVADLIDSSGPLKRAES